MLRKTYLQEHRKALFSKMLLCDELWPHLLEVDEQAHAMLETMVTQMAKAEGVTESLKSTDPMRWIGLMNSFKSAAGEIIMRGGMDAKDGIKQQSNNNSNSRDP